jgi:hypothetical protein
MCRVMSEAVGTMAYTKWSQGRPNSGLGFRVDPQHAVELITRPNSGF